MCAIALEPSPRTKTTSDHLTTEMKNWSTSTQKRIWDQKIRRRMSPRPRNIADHHVAELELQPITPQQTMEKNIVDLEQKKKNLCPTQKYDHPKQSLQQPHWDSKSSWDVSDDKPLASGEHWLEILLQNMQHVGREACGQRAAREKTWKRREGTSAPSRRAGYRRIMICFGYTHVLWRKWCN